MKKILIPIFTILITGILLIAFIQSNPVFANDIVPRDKLTDHDFDSILPLYDESDFITYTTLRDEINDYVTQYPSNPNQVVNLIHTNIVLENKIIRIDTAIELYRFSVDVSFLDTILYESETTKLPFVVQEKLLDLDYVLGADIDYSVMKSRQFVPIGYEFDTIAEEIYQAAFTGTFNGQGFEISNLYVAGYSSLVITEGQDETEIDTIITEYYAMFSHNEGIITNVGLVNPTFELRTDHDDLTQAANLVGLNKGQVSHVYVIDDREPADGGIRMRTPTGASNVNYEAAGVVYENRGASASLSYAYFAAKTVVNQSNVNAFTVQPVLFKNIGGTISNLVFDQTLYLTQIVVGGSTIQITPANSSHTGESTTLLKSGSSSLGSQFYYYPEDRYPALYGLSYQDNQFEIHNALDFIYFNKMMTLDSLYLGINYQAHRYQLMNHINMDDVKANLYQTPSTEFNGILSGLYLDGGVAKSYHIYNLEILNGVEIDGGYYIGLFSTLTGEVSNISFSNLDLKITNSSDYYNSHFYVGAIAGQLVDGKIENILLDLDLNFGSGALGAFSIGSIAGRASGQIMGVYLEGTMDIGQSHTYTSEQNITGPFYLGGIVGRTGQTRLTLYNALNTIDLISFGSSNQMNLNSATSLYVGGILGYSENTAIGHHDFGLLTNEGEVTIHQVSATQSITQYVGGIIGQSTGIGYELNEYSGIWTNKAKLNLENRGSNPVVAANILTSNHSAATEFIYLYNLGTTSNFSINNYSDFKYTTLIYHVGLGHLTLSQSKNEAHVTFTNSAHTHDYSGVFHSEQSGGLLRFVENSGNITFEGFTTNLNFQMAGITTATNTSFLNVLYSGNIALFDITFNPTASTTSNTYHASNNQNNRNIWVAGITNILSSGQYLKNSFNGGNIYLADINARQNVYIGGLVNQNLSGDLQGQESSAQPKATLGILNSINNANIKSSLPSSYGYSGYGFTGLGNIFVGGITTFNGSSNGGSIQDTINLGDIEIAQINLLSDSGVSDNTAFASTNDGGNVTRYRRGVVLGGIAAAITNGQSRIYDSVNSGNVYGMSYFFARTGGVLATALREEMTSGNVNTDLFTSQTDVTNAQTILNSVLSNGLNYGNISAITAIIGEYSTSGTSSVSASHRVGNNSGAMNFHTSNSISTSVTTRASTQDRPGVRASSGGVIGYGLSTMKKMLNHGQISSTDVAGGVVGATVVLATFSVKIDTAINYGTVRMIRASQYTNFNQENMNYVELRNAFYDVNDAFLYPTTLNGNDATAFPEAKRGIGGVFGRLQRGVNMYMQTTGSGIFDFVVNMDPNVDLIGRLDQVYDFSSSNRFFLFPNALYYSAKLHDSTQSVFAGHEVFTNSSGGYRDNVKNIVEQGRYEYRVNGGQVQRKLQHYHMRVTDRDYTGTLNYFNGTSNQNLGSGQTRTIRRTISTNPSQTYWFDVTGTWENVNIEYPGQYSEPFWVDQSITVQSTGSYVSRNEWTYASAREIPFVSEVESVSNAEYIYDEDFIMRNDSTMVDGKPITSYIYYVENEVLSGRFVNERLGGMYVLASSAGSQFGATLPANVVLDKIYPLSDLLPFDVDYNNISVVNKNPFDQNIIDSYESLYQTSLNDKSKLLTTADQNIEMNQVGGLQTKIFGNSASISHPSNGANRIDLRINIAQLGGQTSMIQRMVEALIPSNALIAARLQDYDGGIYASNPPAYRQQLLLEKDLGIAYNAGPIFNMTNLSIGTRSVGYFTSYSQAALDNDAFFVSPKYQTTYQVYVTFYEGSVLPQLYQFYVNNNTSAALDNQTITSTNYTFANTTISSALRVVYRRQSFNTSTTYVPLGYDLKNTIVLQYYDGSNYHIVDPSYYTLTTMPYSLSGSTASMEFNINFDSRLRGGSYRIIYEYAPNSPRYINFTRVTQSSSSILQIAHYSQAVISPSGQDFTTNVNFDYNGLNLDTLTATSTINTSLPVYVDNYDHNVSFLTQFRLSPFARINSATLISTTYNAGYKTYHVRYVILNENGTTTDFNHHITERIISVQNIYKDNVGSNINNLFALREANQTVFGINYNVDPTLINQIYHLETSNPNQHFKIEVTALDPNNQPMATEDIVGISYTTTNRLNIIMSRDTLPGRYTFSISYLRGSEEVTITPNIVITKNEGTVAYLEDIRFSENAQDTDYPFIYIANASGIPITSSYIPSVYFAGIDYDGADLANVQHFRIDGSVANIPLNEYVPLMLDYLPAGATISRKVQAYEKTNPSDPDWTPDVNNQTTNLVDLERLQADFTLLSDGSEPSDEQEVIITYRMTSEDGNQVVYYHITVIDVVYNFSVIFEVYYVTINEQGLLENTVFENETVIIDVVNFHALDSNGNAISIDTPATSGFPTFASISGIESNVTMFYSAIGEATYRYRFGRNKSGFYNFEVITPGYDYNYKIYFNGNELTDTLGMSGKYFYIQSGTRNRTRRFQIVIYDEDISPTLWGLYEYSKDWDHMN
ncbi:hypothetical protein [Acholeplasma laidlawii]|uniref:hypothetical protein n=1 Tax=Acholeplasma laidlawii TaxID=2148 RepID=UPI0021F7CF64|nr:hypothetical protein [Acholeplasma laidlawii]